MLRSQKPPAIFGTNDLPSRRHREMGSASDAPPSSTSACAFTASQPARRRCFRDADDHVRQHQYAAAMMPKKGAIMILEDARA